MSYLGDFPEDGVVDFKFSTNDANGGSVSPEGSPNGVVAVYIGNSVSQVFDGITLSQNFDGVTGVHHVRIDLSSSASYQAGSECQVVLSGAGIDGEIVNAVLAHFSIVRAGGQLAQLAAVLSALTTVDAVVDAIQAKTDNLPSDPADQSLVIAATTAIYDRIGAPAGASIAVDIAGLPTAGETADAVWDEQVDGSVTARQSVRLANSALGGKASIGVGTAAYRDLADTKDRISATVDEDGNRSAVTRDLT